MEGAVVDDSAAPVVVALEAAVEGAQRVEDAAGEEDSVVSAVAPEASVDADQHIEDVTPPEDGKDGSTEGNVDVTPEEIRSVIEVIADTGKHDWNFLKRLLSLQLKQVLAEYSEGQMVSQEGGQLQNSFSGETYSELVSRLNDALLRFEEGPPFTLQRLCEILLDPKGTYTKLSKLALALEKNLLVTSTLTKCTDPYPATHVSNLEGTTMAENTSAVDVEPERLPEHPAAMPNGNVGVDGDAEMADAETEEPSSSHGVEMQEDKPDQISNVNPDANSDTAVNAETVDDSEKPSDPQT